MRKYIITSLTLIVSLFVIGGMKAQTLDAKRIDRLVKTLTLEEKARLLVGTEKVVGEHQHKVLGSAGFTFPIDSLGINSINLADGPAGVRIHPKASNVKYTSYATCFPSPTSIAATWDYNLAKEEGRAIGEEAYKYGVDIVLTPGINIMRNPLCGRNFEYYSEDPLLGGRLAAGMINGIQSQGVGTSLKHFIANNQQTGKLYNDARISQRALREIYLKGFEICLGLSNPWTVMSSYNKIGGKYTQCNAELLRTLLEGEWKYDGVVVSDWYKKRYTPDQVNGGTILLMPGEQCQIDEIIAAVKSGEISEKVLDESVKKVLTLVSKCLSNKGWKYTGAPDLKKNAELSRKIATESMVLLKNDSLVLPIESNAKIALFGATAYKSIAGGTGSSNVNKPYITDIYKGLENAGFVLDADLKRIYKSYADYRTDLQTRTPNSTDWEDISYNRTTIAEMNLHKGDMWINKAAKDSKYAIVVLGRDSGEESDRTLDGGYYLTADEKEMLNKITAAFHAKGKKVVVVLNACGVMEVASWRDKMDAILMAWFPGQECGDAVADVLTGKVNPSGKLPMTFPIDYYDIPSSKNYPTAGVTKSGKNFDYTQYEEGIWVGYRYFDTADVKVAYPFGYGLSYTQFEYSSPKINKKGDKWEAQVTVKNIGKVAGKEVVQLYVMAPNGDIVKPTAELKAFAKTQLLSPGERETVTVSFKDYDIASFDEADSQWLTSKGTYTASFGLSSEKMVASMPFVVKKDKTWKVNNILAPVERVNEIKLK